MAISRWADERRRPVDVRRLYIKEFANTMVVSEREVDLVMSTGRFERAAQWMGMERAMTQTCLVDYLRMRLWGSAPIIHRTRRHRVPADWWQHAKLAFSQALHRAGLPFTWLRGTVRWTEINVAYEYEHICPHVDVEWKRKPHWDFLLHKGEYAPEETA